MKQALEGTLSALMPGEAGTVRDICCDRTVADRLMDLGMVPGAKIECRHKRTRSDLGAYRFCGSTLVLRGDITKRILLGSAP